MFQLSPERQKLFIDASKSAGVWLVFWVAVAGFVSWLSTGGITLSLSFFHVPFYASIAAESFIRWNDDSDFPFKDAVLWGSISLIFAILPLVSNFLPMVVPDANNLFMRQDLSVDEATKLALAKSMSIGAFIVSIVLGFFVRLGIYLQHPRPQKNTK